MKIQKRCLAAILAIAMLVTTMLAIPVETDASRYVTVTISIEKFVIGQGYVVEPTRMLVKKGAQVSDVFEAVMKQENKKYELSAYGYYIDAIEDKDRGEIKVSEKIRANIEATKDYNGNFLTLRTEDATPDMLGSFDYCDYAGWMFMINDILGYSTMDTTPVNNGDVIRVQFTLLGGADIDPTEYDWSTPVYPDMASRVEITRILGYINALVKEDGDYIEKNNLKEAYEKAHKLAMDLETSKEDMKAAEEAFGIIVEDKEKDIDDVKVHSVKKTTETDAKKAYTDAISYAKKTKKAAYGNEWTVITLKRAGASNCKSYYDSYLKNLKTTLVKNKGKLPSAKATDYARVCIALSALGKNAAKFEGYNLIKNITNVDEVTKQGLNGTVYALLALDAANYKDSKGTRTTLINSLLSSQLADGGFALRGKTADADMTAMILTALAPYYNKREEVKKVVDEALNTLSFMQQSNGSFYSMNACNAESNAQVIMALTALQINPRKDARFIKNGRSVMDALLSFKTTSGQYKHTIDGKSNAIATIQAGYALTAYRRMVNKKSPFFQI